MLREYAAEGRWPGMLRDMRRTQEEMNRILSGLRFPLGLSFRSEFPPVNVWAGPDGAIVTAEVPGVGADQIDVTVHQDTVTLRGKREPAAIGEDAVVHRQERPQGLFARTVMLPFRVDADKVSARFERGTLTLDLPRPASDKPRHIKVAPS